MRRTVRGSRLSTAADNSQGSVLIADDDPALCELLSNYLLENGFRVIAVHSAEAAMAALQQPPLPDLLVLDVMLPGMDGLTALKHIREASSLPVLMLSGRGEPVDRVVGLELGADDYLTKPCLPRELLARIQALLRRVRQPQAVGNEIRVGALRVHPGQRRAWLGQQQLDLTGAELSVLIELARHSGQVVSREQLTVRGLNRALERFDRSIDVHISRLRNKLSSVPGAMLLIEAVRGAGYLLRPDST